MALTVAELNAHIDHFNVYNTLPIEVIHELFAAAMTVAAQTNPAEAIKGITDGLNAEADKVEVATPKKARSK